MTHVLKAMSGLEQVAAIQAELVAETLAKPQGMEAMSSLQMTLELQTRPVPGLCTNLMCI